MHFRLASRVACAAAAAFSLAFAGPAQAQIGSDRYSAIVLDHRTGSALVAASADETRFPASLTKMMTLYMLFEQMREGRLTLASPITMSEEAASRPPSKLGVPAGQTITVEQAILALVTRSANDVAAAVGERIGGSEARFAQMMTTRARALGMTRTTFRNASGLPDLDQVTTARDMATLGRRLIEDFPQHYHYFGVTHAQFGAVRVRNHNGMLSTYEGVDGIKTGYIRDSGFNIVTSATRGGQRLVGAVFGGSSWVERDAHMAMLLDEGFQRLGVPMASGDRGFGLIRTAEAAPLPSGRGVPVTRIARTEPTVSLASRRAFRQGRTAQAAGIRTAQAPRSPAVRQVIAPSPRPTVQRARPATTTPPQARPARAAPPTQRSPGTLQLPQPAGRVRTAELR
jgi:D-alanyl-D-alanine carboxypeptidase